MPSFVQVALFSCCHLPCSAYCKAWCVTTDAGSDVSHSRRLLEAAISGTIFKVMFGMDCLYHQFHLITLGLLYGLDTFIMPCFGFESPPRYYTIMASTMHVWRDNCKDIFEAWCSMYGPVEAQRCAASVPPRPISGRWGRKAQCEEYLLKCDPEHVAAVFTRVLATRSYYTDYKPDDAVAGNIGEAVPERGRGRGRARGRGRGRGGSEGQ